MIDEGVQPAPALWSVWCVLFRRVMHHCHRPLFSKFCHGGAYVQLPCHRKSNTSMSQRRCCAFVVVGTLSVAARSSLVSPIDRPLSQSLPQPPCFVWALLSSPVQSNVVKPCPLSSVYMGIATLQRAKLGNHCWTEENSKRKT